MCPNRIFSRLTAAAFAAGLVAFIGALPAAAEDLRLGSPAPVSQTPISQTQGTAPTFSSFATSALSVGYLTPGYSSSSMGLVPARSLNGMNSGYGLARALDVGGKYTAPVSIGRIGIYGEHNERPSMLSLTPSTAWNFGASLGYGGFYVSGGARAASSAGPLLGIQGMQAGFGYEMGDLDVRVTYLTAQSVGTAEREIDSKQWSIGGIYNITSRIRLNADAFYGVGEGRGTALSVQPPSATGAPPGTGARVGVQLRF